MTQRQRLDLFVLKAAVLFCSLLVDVHGHGIGKLRFDKGESHRSALQTTAPSPSVFYTPPAVNNFLGNYLEYVYVNQNNNGIWKVEPISPMNLTSNVTASYAVVNYKNSNYESDSFGTLFTIVSALNATSTAPVVYGDNLFLRVTDMPTLYLCKANGTLYALPDGFGAAACKFTITWKHQCSPDPFTGKSYCVQNGMSITYNGGSHKLFMSSQLIGALPNQRVQCPYNGPWENYELVVG